MSKIFNITARFARHKSGTKFYQAFSMHEVGKPPVSGVTVGHYGKADAIPFSWDQLNYLRPVLGGQVDVWRQIEVSFTEKCNAKFAKGGYVIDEHTWTYQVDQRDIERVITDNFGAKYAHKVLLALQEGIVLNENDEPEHIPAPPTVEIDNSLLPEKPSETWGAW